MGTQFRVKSRTQFSDQRIFLPAVIGLVLAELKKIEAGFWPLFQVQINCEVSNRGLNHHRHVVGGL